MSNYQDWTAGKHWREGMDLLGRAANPALPGIGQLAAVRALVHLAAAKLLLDHPPVDVLDAYPVEAGVEPPKDWRNDRA